MNTDFSKQHIDVKKTRSRTFRALVINNRPGYSGQVQAQRLIHLSRVRRDMATVRIRLREIVTTEEAERWIHTPNPVFNNVRPVNLIRGGKTAKVLQVITAVAEGIHV